MIARQLNNRTLRNHVIVFSSTYREEAILDDMVLLDKQLLRDGLDQTLHRGNMELDQERRREVISLTDSFPSSKI